MAHGIDRRLDSLYTNKFSVIMLIFFPVRFSTQSSFISFLKSHHNHAITLAFVPTLNLEKKLSLLVLFCSQICFRLQQSFSNIFTLTFSERILAFNVSTQHFIKQVPRSVSEPVDENIIFSAKVWV